MIDHLFIHQISIDNQTEFNEMNNFDLNELMDLAEAYVGPTIDAIYRRLMDREFAGVAGRLNKHLLSSADVAGQLNKHLRA